MSMSSFISPRIIVLCVIYLTIIYSVLGAFGHYNSADGGLIHTYATKPLAFETNFSQYGDGKVTQEEANKGGITWAIVGTVLGSIVGIALVLTGVGAPAGAGILGATWSTYAVGLASVGIGATGGFIFGKATTYANGDKAGSISAPMILDAVMNFLGHVFGMMIFLWSFMTISGEMFGSILPEYMFWLIYIMVLPIWIYFAVATVELSIRAIQAIRSGGKFFGFVG